MGAKSATMLLILMVYIVTSIESFWLNGSPQNQNAAHSFPGQPIQVLSVDQYGNTTIHLPKFESLSHVEIMNRKIMVFSVAGAYRQGKSFFLCYCIRYLYATYKSIKTMDTFTGSKTNWMGSPTDLLIGFSWKHGRFRDTNGILFWDDIFLYDNPKTGEKSAILLMDTQGLFEPSVPESVSRRIIGLATVISSVQVINIKGYIQENQLEYLEMSTQFTEHIQKKTRKSGQISNTKPFQNLIFLYRDWADQNIGLGYEGGEIYKQDVMSMETFSKAAMNVRKNIDKAFEKISFFLLPHPGEIVADKNYDGSYDKLHTEFKENLKVLIESIFAPKNLKHKKVFGEEIKGAEFGIFVAECFKAYTNIDIPKVETFYETMERTNYIKMSYDLLEEYDTKMNTNNNFDDDNFMPNLKTKHTNLKENILKKLNETPNIADKDLKEKAVHNFSSNLDIRFSKMSIKLYEEQQRDQKRKKENEILNDSLLELQRIIDREKNEKLRLQRAEKERAKEQSARTVAGIALTSAFAAYLIPVGMIFLLG